jgi:hypothetical protein
MRAYSTTWLRWVLLVVALACLAAGLWWMAGPLLYGDLDEATTRAAPLSLLTGLDADYWMHLPLFLGVLLLAQWMFLRPRQGWSLRLSETARPMRTAVLAAALMAMLLSMAGLATLLEWIGVWDEALDDGSWRAFPIGAWIAWLLWAAVFFVYWRKGTRFEQLRKMAHGLIVGSVLELLVATGVFLWNKEDDDCWCARGSYTGLIFGATVMIWAFGPGLLFLFLREAQYHEKR